MVVRRVRVIVAIGAVLFWAVTPALACLIPCLAPVPSKQDCAHHMGMDCGHPMMSAGPTCCRMSSRPAMQTLESSSNGLQRRVLAVTPVIVDVNLSDAVNRRTSMHLFGSPPSETPPPSFSVLRI